MGQSGSRIVNALIPCASHTDDTFRPASPNPLQRPAPSAPSHELADLQASQINRRNQAGGASGSQVRVPVLEPLEPRPSVGSVVKGDKYYTTGPVQTSDMRLGLKRSELRQHKLTLKEEGKLYEGDRLLNGDEVKYVLDGSGNLYSDMNKRLLYHTDFLSSGRVAAAGEIRAKEGHITAIDNKSGHYKPTTKHTDQVIQELKGRGLDICNVERNEHTSAKQNIRLYRDVDDTWIRKLKEH